MVTSFLSILLLTLATIASQSGCPCTKAADDDVPHGANEVIEYGASTTKRIFGRVLTPDEKPAGDVVVELYELPKNNGDLRVYQFVREHQRRDACITAPDGTFCFSDVPSGKYLLRAGTRSQRDMNEIYVHVTVDRRWLTRWLRRSKRIEIELRLGT